MPLILHKDIEDGKIGLWKITEELSELERLSRLSEPDLIAYSGISALHRKKEWLATRALLNELTDEQTSIRYDNEGRPAPENGKYNISISHTTGFVAVMLHDVLIPGIDIELASRNIGRVARRFLSPEEFEECSHQTGISNEKLLLHWCAKEAIFKMVPFNNIEFSTDILISLNENIQNSGLFAGVFKNHSDQISIPLEYIEECGVVMVWGLVDLTIFR